MLSDEEIDALVGERVLVHTNRSGKHPTQPGGVMSIIKPTASGGYGKLIGHTDNLRLTDVDFAVNQSGWKWLRNKGKRTVVSWLEGTVAGRVRDSGEGETEQVHYNPFMHDPEFEESHYVTAPHGTEPDSRSRIDSAPEANLTIGPHYDPAKAENEWHMFIEVPKGQRRGASLRREASKTPVTDDNGLRGSIDSNNICVEDRVRLRKAVAVTLGGERLHAPAGSVGEVIGRSGGQLVVVLPVELKRATASGQSRDSRTRMQACRVEPECVEVLLSSFDERARGLDRYRPSPWI